MVNVPVVSGYSTIMQPLRGIGGTGLKNVLRIAKSRFIGKWVNLIIQHQEIAFRAYIIVEN